MLITLFNKNKYCFEYNMYSYLENLWQNFEKVVERISSFIFNTCIFSISLKTKLFAQ